MAKARKTGKGAPKKKWVEILAPKIFNQQPIGETHVYDSREALGKTVTVNLMTLTRNPRRQGTNVVFLVTGQHEDKLTTEFIGFRIMPPVTRRMIRRGKNKIEDSFICTTSDRKKVRIKPIIITKSKAKGSVLTALRKAAKAYLVETASQTAYEKLAGDIVDSKLQRSLYEALVKIFPLSNCDIRWFALVKKESNAGEPEKAEEPKKPAEAKEEKIKEEEKEAPKEEKAAVPKEEKVKEVKEEKAQEEKKESPKEEKAEVSA